MGLIVLLCGCGGSEPSAVVRQIRTEDPTYALYQRLICHRCHGADLEGGTKAPSLRELAEHYDVERLMHYLEDPQALRAVDPRLRELDMRYTNFEMPSYATLDSTVRRTLVEFLLDPWKREAH